MPTIMIPGKDKEEAQKKADEEERKMLERQYADPDFLLCWHGEKEWSGSDPCCAFDEDGNFRENNWNCRLMNRARALMGCGWFGIRDEKAPGHSWWDVDHNYGVLYIQSWVNLDQKQPNSYLQGCFILMDWYKSRGKTDSFRILQGDIIREGTEKDALELTKIYSDYLDEKYSEAEAR